MWPTKFDWKFFKYNQNEKKTYERCHFVRLNARKCFFLNQKR